MYKLPYLKHLIFSLIGILLVIGCQGPAEEQAPPSQLPPPALRRMSQAQYGIDVQAREVIQSHLEDQQFVTDVLAAHGVDPAVIDQLSEQAEGVFDLRRMRSGRPYTLIKDRSTQEVEYFIYEPTDADYVVFDLRDGVQVSEGQKKVRVQRREVGSIVVGSLYQSIEAAGYDLRLVGMMESVFAHTVDFLQLDQGDFFKIVYEEELVDEIPIGIKRIVAAQVRQRGVDYFALGFAQDTSWGYFDEEGRSLRQAFLQSPLATAELGELNLREPRFHRRRGMDYLVPEGTPVVSIGDGVIVDMGDSYERGHYLSIRHNGLYTTDYQFLRGISDSLQQGSKVQQGQIIGEVGRRYNRRQAMLRFRLRERGQVTDLRKIKTPVEAPVRQANRPQFDRHRQVLMRHLQDIELQEPSLNNSMAITPQSGSQPLL